MENVSVHAAALKAIEWFKLNAEDMSASSDEESEQSSEVKAQTSTPKQATKKVTTPLENNTPNTPLKFRLDKLEREHPYLVERGLTLETIVDFGIGFCAKGMMADRIAIPIHNSGGNVVAYAGRFPGEPADDTPTYKLPPGFRKSQEIFNIDRAIKEPTDDPLVIVRGFFGCMKIHQHGWHKVVALMSSAMSFAQEELIRKHTNANSHIVIMLDENEAGIAGRENIACRLSKFCYVKIHTFEKPGTEAEHLSREEVHSLFDW
jgi:DNA primase